MKICEHKFDRSELDEIFAHKPISQFINDDMKTNLGTESQNLKKNWKIILSHFQFLKLKFPGPKCYSFDQISDRIRLDLPVVAL